MKLVNKLINPNIYKIWINFTGTWHSFVMISNQRSGILVLVLIFFTLIYCGSQKLNFSCQIYLIVCEVNITRIWHSNLVSKIQGDVNVNTNNYKFSQLLLEITRFFKKSSNFISKARLQLTKNQVNFKQLPEAELLLFKNYSHSSFTLLSKMIKHIVKIGKRTNLSVFMILYNYS